MPTSIRLVRAGILSFLAVGVIFAQAQPARPEFVVASVKPNTSGSNSSSSHGSKGQVVFTNVSLKRMIEQAYNVKSFQVTGPDWMESVNFDLAAKYPPETRDEDKLLMLRALLEDRFKLAIHRESKDRQGYALVIAKGGFKLKPVDAAGGPSTNSNSNGRVTTVTASKVPMAQVVDFVARRMGETVVNKTGIEGAYDFKLRYVNDDQSPETPETAGVPTLANALQENLGLRLQPQKVPVEFIIVDHVERTPIEN